MRYYAGIGSRKCPLNVIKWMERIGFHLRSHGWCLRSGGASGADTAFYDGAVRCNPEKPRCEIFLPEDGFRGHKADGKTFFLVEHPDARALAKKYHPKWSACGPDARNFHTRNVCQVLGPNLNERSEMVICWTSDGEASGGTGQAIRIATQYPKDAGGRRIPIYNLQRNFETLPLWIQELK